VRATWLEWLEEDPIRRYKTTKDIGSGVTLERFVEGSTVIKVLNGKSLEPQSRLLSIEEPQEEEEEEEEEEEKEVDVPRYKKMMMNKQAGVMSEDAEAACEEKTEAFRNLPAQNDAKTVQLNSDATQDSCV